MKLKCVVCGFEFYPRSNFQRSGTNNTCGDAGCHKQHRADLQRRRRYRAWLAKWQRYHEQARKSPPDFKTWCSWPLYKRRSPQYY